MAVSKFTSWLMTLAIVSLLFVNNVNASNQVKSQAKNYCQIWGITIPFCQPAEAAVTTTNKAGTLEHGIGYVDYKKLKDASQNPNPRNRNRKQPNP